MKVSLLHGTVFPFIHVEAEEVSKRFDTLFPVTARLYPVPKVGATSDPIRSLLDSTFLFEDTARYYEQGIGKLTSFDPGSLLHLDNPGTLIHWDSLFSSATPTTEPVLDLGALLLQGELSSLRPIGLFSFANVPVGDYILVLFRAGYLTRFAEIHVTPESSRLGHRELVPGDANGDGEVRFDDILLIFQNTASWNDDVIYDSRYDMNADGQVNSADISVARAMLGFKVIFYSDTREWLEKYK